MSKAVNRLIAQILSAVAMVRLDPFIQEQMAAKGIDGDQLHEAERLIRLIQRLAVERKRETAQRRYFAEQYKSTKAAAEKMYTHHMKWARLAFEGNVEAKADLSLRGRRAKGDANWMQQVREFYDVLHGTPEYQEVMIGVGRTDAELQEGRALARTLNEYRDLRDSHSGDAQHLTAQLNAAVDDLTSWYGFFAGVARHTLKDAPQKLEKLGL